MCAFEKRISLFRSVSFSKPVVKRAIYDAQKSVAFQDGIKESRALERIKFVLCVFFEDS